MKNLIALLAIFLLIGCQTTDELSKEEPPKKEVKSANVDEPFGYPAALYINRETGTSTVLDFLSREQVCMVAAGKNLRLSKEFIPTEGKTIRYLTKSD